MSMIKEVEALIDDEVEKLTDEGIAEYPIRVFDADGKELDIADRNQDGGEIWLTLEGEK